MYVEHAVAYSQFYGTLGILPLFVLWVFIGWVILLFGAEISYTRQHLKVLDLRKIRQMEGNFIRADLLAIAALFCIGKRFYEKKTPPITLSKLSEIFNITEKDMSSLLEVLADEGILARASTKEDDAYVLASAPEKIRINDVVKIASEKLQVRLDKRINQNLADFAPVYNDIIKSEQDNFGKLTLKNLLEKATKAS